MSLLCFKRFARSLKLTSTGDGYFTIQNMMIILVQPRYAQRPSRSLFLDQIEKYQYQLAMALHPLRPAITGNLTTGDSTAKRHVGQKFKYSYTLLSTIAAIPASRRGQHYAARNVRSTKDLALNLCYRRRENRVHWWSGRSSMTARQMASSTLGSWRFTTSKGSTKWATS